MVSDSLEEIKNRLDIVEVIGQYVKLQKAGVNYKALCPFHKEKTPSFFVSPSRQIWHCFGCGLGGDIFSFVMKIENVDFKEAVKILADKAGVKLLAENPVLNSQKQKLINLNEKAAFFFEEQLSQKQEVKDYLFKRGLTETTLQEFKLGFAPDDWRSLTNYLIKEGFKPEEILQSGLAISKKDLPETGYQIQKTDLYDRFRSRIMFPIEDLSSKIVGFTGRIFQGSTPLKTIKDLEAVGKYVNSPQTLIFDKSKILYGLSKTKTFLHNLGSTLLVEGQMDFLMGWQAGLKNIVATSGTSLTAYHLTLLKRYNNTLILGFDMDEAGEKAAERSIELALAQEFQVKVLQLPSGKDLADYLLEQKNQISQASLEQLLAQALPIMDFYFERAKQMGDLNSLEGKKIIVSYFLPKIKKLVNPIDKAFWLEKLSQEVKIEARTLEDELKRLAKDKIAYRDENEPAYQFLPQHYGLDLPRAQLIGERILALLLKDFKLKEKIRKVQNYFPAPLQEVVETILSAESAEDLNPQSLKKLNLKEELINKINELALRGDYELELLEQFQVPLEEEFRKQIKNLRMESVKEKLKQLEKEIAEAEKNKNQAVLTPLMNEFNQLKKDLLDN